MTSQETSETQNFDFSSMKFDLDPARGETYFIDGFLDGFRQRKIVTLSEWADDYRILSQESSAEPGRFKTSRTPYLKEVMDALSYNSPYTEVVFNKGSQIGASESGLNFLAYIVDQAPGSVLIVQPSVDLAKKFSKQRVKHLIDKTPAIKDKFFKNAKGSKEILQKDFEGGSLILTGANSSTGLSSMPIKYLFLDEIDRYPDDVDGEGSPIKLATTRTNTFAKKKIYYVSTPTIKGQSKIETEYENTDQRKYFVPCPHCDHYQLITWSKIKWEKDKPETAHMECEACQEKILEHHKVSILKKGKWIATNPEFQNKRRVGFFISALYSPYGWYSWEQAVRDFLDATKSTDDKNKLKTFVNTVLGESWSEETQKSDWKSIYTKRENYKQGFIHKSIKFLTAGVDVQKDRIEMQVMGWNENKEGFSVEYNIFNGDTGSLSNPVWGDLRAALFKSYFCVENGITHEILLTMIDSGFNTHTVYQFVKQFSSRRVVAIKGQDDLRQMIGIGKAVDVKVNGKPARRGLRIFPIGVNIIKEQIYSCLNIPQPTESEMIELGGYPSGYLHFPEYGEEFFKQLASEAQIEKFVRGRKTFAWVKVYERNEALDTLVMARAAAQASGLERLFYDIKLRGPRPVDRVRVEENIEKSEEKSENFNENEQKNEKKEEKINFSSNVAQIKRKRSSFWDNR